MSATSSRFFARNSDVACRAESSETMLRIFTKKKRHSQGFAVENEQEYDVCSICLDNCLGKSGLDCCKHQFCFSCIKAWSQINHSCPICKMNFVYINNGGVRHDIALRAMKKIDYVLLEGIDDEEREESSDHGYEQDGFVVDDDFIEYESDSDALPEIEEEFVSSRKKRRLE